MRKIKACVVCGFEEIEAGADEVTCSRCKTRYDLVNHKIDNSQTMVAPMDCRHHRTNFLQSRRWTSTEDHGRYRITVCPDCGEFRVCGFRNGQSFDITFDLVRPEDVTAAGKFVRLLEAEEHAQ